MDIPRGLSHKGIGVVAFWFTVIMVVLADQATKAAVMHTMPVGSPARTFIPGLIDLYHVENTGAAFGIGRGASWLFIGCAAVVFAFACLYVWRNHLPISLCVSIGCVAGGGVANMVDRMANGSVTDFFATTFMDFPVFNVADIFVTCGVIVSLLLYFRWDGEISRDDRPGRV